MRYRLVIHPAVETDIAEGYDWYEDQLKGLGERFLHELDTCYDKLEDHPEYFSQVTKGYRRVLLTHFPYMIAYEIEGDTVQILAVFHSKRNLETLSERTGTH